MMIARNRPFSILYFNFQLKLHASIIFFPFFVVRTLKKAVDVIFFLAKKTIFIQFCSKYKSTALYASFNFIHEIKAKLAIRLFFYLMPKKRNVS